MALNPYDDALEQLPAAASPTERNPYADLLDREDAANGQRLRTSLVQAHDANPDLAAEAQALSRQTGIPTDVVRRNFDAIKKRATLTGLQIPEMHRDTPALATWASEPANAAVAKDDLEHLGFLEWVTTAWPRAIAQQVNQLRYSELRYKGLFELLTQEERDQLGSYKYASDIGGKLGAGESWFRQSITGAGQLLAQGFEPGKYAAVGAGMLGAIGAVVGSVVPGAGTYAGGVAGLKLGAEAGGLYGVVKTSAQQETAQAYDELLTFRDEVGQPLDPGVAKVAALAVGGLNGLVEIYGVETFLKSFPALKALKGEASRVAMRQALRSPTLRAAFSELAQTYGSTLTKEVATEVAQRAIALSGEELAKVADNAKVTPFLSPSGQVNQPGSGQIAHRTAVQWWDELLSEAASAAPTFALGILPGPAMGLVHGAVAARRATQAQAVFQALGEGATQSKTIERAPEAARAFIARATKDGPIETVYAPIDTFTAYWQTKGVDPETIAADLTGNPEAYQAAVNSGEDLAIPTATYAVKLAGTEHNAFFANELRLGDPTAMNAREAQAFQQTIQAQQAAAVEAQQPAPTPAEQVRAHVAEQFEAAGIPKDTAQTYAALYEGAFGAMAERAGLDPLDLYRSYGLTVERPALASSIPPAQPGTQPATGPISPVVPASGAVSPATSLETVPGVPPAVAAEFAPVSPTGEERRAASVGPPATGERRRTGLANPIVEAAAQMRAENPHIDRDAAAMRASHAAARVDTLPSQPQTEGEPIHADTGAADPTTNIAGDQLQGDDGGEAGGRDRGSVSGVRAEGLSPQVQRHTDIRFDAVLADALTAGYTGTPAALHTQLADRITRSIAYIADQRQADEEHSGAALLDAIRALGGIKPTEVSGKQRAVKTRRKGAATGPLRAKPEEYEHLRQALAANWGLTNLTNIFRHKGLLFDDMQQQLGESGQWPEVAEHGLLVTLERIADRGPVEDTTIDEVLRGAYGVRPGEVWWDALDTAQGDQGADAGGDISFDPREFFQRVFGLPFDPTETTDTLPTGEQQARLPGDVGDVRTQEVATPQIEAPFSLTSEVSTAKKGQQTTLFQPLFHGSPHDFDRFSSEKIGTGEGAQVFGHGLYFAESQEVAAGYHRALAENAAINEMKVGSKRVGQRNNFDYSPRGTSNYENVQSSLIEDLLINETALHGVETGGFSEYVLKTLRGKIDAYRREWPEGVGAAEKLLADLQKPGALAIQFDKTTGGVYQVDIPDEQIARMLDWDRPLAEQPAVLRELARFGAEPAMTGEQGYRLLEAYVDRRRDPRRPFEQMRGADELASERLRQAGIPGIKYLDQGSRTAGDGTRNVVVFDDSIVTITHKDGTPVTSKERREFFQSMTFGQEKRGSLRFGADRQMTISLFEQADLSTAIHESAHLFLEVLSDLAGRPGASEQITADLQTLREWAKDDAHTGPGFSEAQHEQIARGFEAYLLEGKAPSIALRSVFSRMRAWLLGIYRTVKSLNVRLNPDVRAVFDRMLATDQAIAEAAAVGQIAPMFLTPESAGMSPEEFGLYQQTVAAASRTATERLERQILSEVHREQTAAWKDQRATIQATVTEEVHQQPVYRALAAMQKGTNPDGTPLEEGVELHPLKLSKQVLIERYGADRLATLPRPYVYTVEGGLDPEVVAELFGFSSGDELLAAVTGVPSMHAAIEAETSRRMLAQHGSLLLDGTLHQKAQAALANEDREEVVKAELRALAGLKRTAAPFIKAGRTALEEEKRERAYERRWFEAEAKLRIAVAEGRKQIEIDALTAEVQDLKRKARGGAATIRAAIPPQAVLIEHARQRIAGMQVRDIKPQVFWSASRRAAQQATDHAARQNFDGAIVAKQQELVNLAVYREAERVLEDIAARATFAKGLDRAASRARITKAGMGIQDQIDGVLDRYEFATISKKTLDRRADIRHWVAALDAEGIPASDVIPDDLLNDTRRTNYQELTVEQFVGITDGLKALVHLARMQSKLLKAADERDFAIVRDGVVDSIRTKNTARTIPLEFRPADQKYRRVAEWFASHAKIAILARALDGYQDAGPMWQAIIRPINAAADAEALRIHDVGKAYGAILDQYYPGRELASLNDKLHIPAIGGSLSKEARLAVLLNWGNQTSRDRLLNDPSRRWNEEQITAILDTLDARDGQFAQATWDYINTFWPEIADKQLRVTGLKPEKVEALEVQTKYGVLRGGYYPLAYDGRLAPRADQLASAGEAKLAVAAAYVSSTTRRGHTKARLENVRLPVRLELGVMFSHLTQVIHDLTHHEMLIDTTRLLRDRDVQAALLETRGDLVYRQFTSALEDIALGSTGGKAKPNAMDTAATWMKSRTQIAGLGWNLWTGLQQPLGVFNGMSRVGPVWVARGMKRWLRDAASLHNTAGWISEVSPLMRERSRTWSQDIHDLRGQLTQPGGWFDGMLRAVSGDRLTQRTITDGFLWHIGLAQRVADIPTWLGGYEKAMAGGHDEATAIALADQGVLDSQGGGQIKDLAQVQRGGPIAKLFLTFFSYGNMLGNATAERYGATSFKSPASVATFLGHLSLLYVMPALATVALSRASGKTDDDDPEGFAANVAQEMLGTALNTMVFVRELGGLTRSGARGYEGPAGTRLIQLVTKFAQEVEQGKLDEGLERAAGALSGVLFRYPAAQVQRTIDGWVALEEGRTTNPGVLLVGPPAKKKAQ